MTNPNPAAPRNCVHGVDHGEECPECGFGWNPNPAAPLTAEALIGYLWTATGRDRETRVCDLFDDDDPLVRDVEAVLAARATSTPSGLREAASDLADAVDTYLDNKRSPELWVADRARVWKAAKEVRAALQGADR